MDSQAGLSAKAGKILACFRNLQTSVLIFSGVQHPRMNHFILTPFGSSGDVNPFLWMGKLLRQRGHEVSVITGAAFRESVEHSGLDFLPIGNFDTYRTVIRDPDLWHPTRGPRRVLKYAVEQTLAYFQAIQTVMAGHRGTPVLVGPIFAFGTRLAREKLKIPFITIHLQPSCFFSVHDTPVFGHGYEWITRLPIWVKRLLFKLPNPIDSCVLPRLTTICEEENITPPKHILQDWWHSPDGSICLFPDWFAAPQPDWPSNVLMAGFPLYDQSDQYGITADLEDFLHAGPKPVLFTPGSAMLHAHSFFATGLKACKKLKLRALFVTPHRDQLPATLPETVKHCDFVPFSQVLPQCSLMIHHGGVGTLSQALAAGIPQLVMPMAHDQPDNARRLLHLGVARTLHPGRFQARNVAREMKRLIRSVEIHAACRKISAMIQAATPARRITELLEGFGEEKVVRLKSSLKLDVIPEPPPPPPRPRRRKP